jgi:hypothetical protein
VPCPRSSPCGLATRSQCTCTRGLDRAAPSVMTRPVMTRQIVAMQTATVFGRKPTALTKRRSVSASHDERDHILEDRIPGVSSSRPSQSCPEAGLCTTQRGRQAPGYSSPHDPRRSSTDSLDTESRQAPSVSGRSLGPRTSVSRHLRPLLDP